MNTLGRLILAVLLPGAAGAAAAQAEFVIPSLSPGDRVRVHVLEQRTFLGMPTLELRGSRYKGLLTAYAPPDSLALRREGWLLFFTRRREVVAYWDHVRRIDVPEGRNFWGGVAGGAGFALGAAISLAFTDLLVCRPWGGSCLPGFWKTAAYVAVVSVPVGAVVGALSPRWKPVYVRRGS